jgi:Ca2+:H+ antiporter
MKQFIKPLNALLIFLPIAFIAELAHWSPVAIFITAALAVVPLSGLLGDGTEELAARTGPRIGALINATLGNAAELIITILAIRQGLLELVRASIVGSIIGNILLVLGASLLFGGLKHGIQKFSPSQAGLNATLLVMAAVVLTVPSFFAFAIEPDKVKVELLSLLTAAVIIVIYVLSLIYSMRAPAGDPLTREAAHTPHMSLPLAIGVLIVSTALIAIMSEFLVGAVEPMTEQLGISELFVGIILVPIIGNIAEHVVAIEVALKNKMDLSLGIAIGSSLQIALFVAPLLVFISLLFGQYLTLEFTSFELVALLASCFIAAAVSMDGRSNWLEGALLIGLYVIVGIAFYFLPVA